jgi:hypothetical protein
MIKSSIHELRIESKADFDCLERRLSKKIADTTSRQTKIISAMFISSLYLYEIVKYYLLTKP